MSIRRLASISLLIFANLLIGFFYLQSRRPLPLSNGYENDTLVWNSSESRQHAIPFNTTNGTFSNLEPFPHPYHYIINSKDLCSKGLDGKEKLQLTILVCSAVQNVENRRAIRETWGSLASFRKNSTRLVKLGFLLGSTNSTTLQQIIDNESLMYGDIIQESFNDSYQNLTIKSVMLLKWISEYCPNVHFVLKTDDDMYVNIPRLLTTLTKLPVKNKVMYGTLFRKAKPNRTPSAKWYVPREQFQADVFPDYLSGTGYIISRDVIPTLFEISSTLPFLVMEDVFITGLCASEAGVRRYNIQGFAHWKRSATGCAFRDAITGHHVTIKDMHKIWNELQNTRLICRLTKKRL